MLREDTYGTETIVVGIIEDAREIVQIKNPYVYEPPKEGHRFYLITVKVAYPFGTGSVKAEGSEYRLIGDNRVAYKKYGNGCGAIPDALYTKELYPGGKVQGNLCFEVPKDEGNFVLMLHDRFLSIDPLRLSSPEDLVVEPPAPDPAALALPPGMSLDNPVPVGGVLAGFDGIETVVSTIVDNAWDLLRAENHQYYEYHNDSPEVGKRYYMITLEVKYVSGTDSLDLRPYDYRLVGDNRVVYWPCNFSLPISVEIPDDLRAELFPGGKVRGNVCFEVGADDKEFVLIHEAGNSPPFIRRFLSLE